MIKLRHLLPAILLAAAVALPSAASAKTTHRHVHLKAPSHAPAATCHRPPPPPSRHHGPGFHRPPPPPPHRRPGFFRPPPPPPPPPPPFYPGYAYPCPPPPPPPHHPHAHFSIFYTF